MSTRTVSASRRTAFESPVLVCDHTPCDLCCWVWCPSIGGSKTPFVRKFANAACPSLHDCAAERELAWLAGRDWPR